MQGTIIKLVLIMQDFNVIRFYYSIEKMMIQMLKFHFLDIKEDGTHSKSRLYFCYGCDPQNVSTYSASKTLK